MQDGRAIPAFITQALRGEPITVFGQGGQTRSFGYVDDLVEGLVRLLASNYADPVNIGNPEEYTILELAQRIIELTKSASRIIHQPLPQDDPKQRCPDITVAKRVLQWQATTPLAVGLPKTIEWFRKEIAAHV